MKKLLFVLLLLESSFAAEPLFEEPFAESLKPGWEWIREDRSAWRLRNHALEIRLQPGNMWGPENSGKNVLVRSLPPLQQRTVTVSMIVENKPSHQYEQTDLVCYFDDSHMVKIGEELVDRQLSIVMGREENDKTRTIKIIPLVQARVELRLVLQEHEVTGQFRLSDSTEWQTAGTCDLPAPGQPRIAIQCYQGLSDEEHWARIENFRIESAPLR